ncbi:META and DUF4377 domain-containing protein [Castellaniella sp.]|uniref:META and DUF4377 domain-containing protein n=1 Tax=Castellaniella sp. TaxID=1955812 RepID=UPI002AFF214B|nr:META and DUF4377 domain-containing protein [Castellaniella sp.]
MKNALAACSLALVLGACAQTPATAPSAMTTSSLVSLDTRTLAAYDWRLTDGRDAQGRELTLLGVGTDSPVRLAFSDKTLQVLGGCNAQFGGYALAAGQLQAQGLAATMKACSPDLMQRDQAMAGLLKHPLAAKVSGQPGEPILELKSQSGDVLRFAGQPTPETLTGSQGVVEFLEVAPQTVACSHPLIADHRCLNVRERQYSAAGVLAPAAGPWHPLYDAIRGYTHHEGTATILRVKRYDWKNPPADASSVLYVLDLVVQQGR